MPAPLGKFLVCAAMLLPLAACGDSGPPEASEPSGLGASPKLPKPETGWFPTVNIAPAVGWKEGQTPVAASGLSVSAFATGLNHPRWLYVLPNGDVLVAESNAPAVRKGREGLRGWVMGLVMKRAGAGVESPDQITLLRDANGDGVAETRTVFASKLHSPFGMALVGETLYVANADALVAFAYKDGQTEVAGDPRKIADLPGEPRNHHWTKNVIASRDGTKLYVAVGSNSNVAENGMDIEKNRAAILEVDPTSGATRIFASGLRNPVGMAWEPSSGALWTAVNERDELGNHLVPDYMTSVQEGGFYGWPYSYYGQHVDTRVQPQQPDLVAKAIVPDYALGSHTASLGLTFYQGSALPRKYAGGAFVGQHGSWNRSPRAGYKVIFVPFAGGKPNGDPQDVLTGFIDADGNAQGRPVGVIADMAGALLVADDVGNAVWRLTAAQSTAANPEVAPRAE